MSHFLPFTVDGCTARSEERPASLLTEGDGTKGWLTDMPRDRASLFVDLGDYYNVEQISIVGYCTHIEVRGSPIKLEGATLRSPETVILVRRTELVDMFKHKAKLGGNYLSLVRTPSGVEKSLAPPLQKLTVDVSKGVGLRYLEFVVMCHWEPEHRIGLGSIEIFGSEGGAPTPAAAVTPIKVPKSPPAATTPIDPTAAYTAPPVPAAPAAVKVEKAVAAPKPPKPVVDPLAKYSGAPSTAPPASPATPPTPPPTPAVVAPKVVGTAPAPSTTTAAPSTTAATAATAAPLRHCVLVLSGYQNPLRSEIRDKAISCGAKVLNDWTSICTHLICVAPSTPKYHEVNKSGHGIIVSKEWILTSFDTKKRARESSYLVGSGGPDAPKDDDG